MIIIVNFNYHVFSLCLCGLELYTYILSAVTNDRGYRGGSPTAVQA